MKRHYKYPSINQDKTTLYVCLAYVCEPTYTYVLKRANITEFFRF